MMDFLYSIFMAPVPAWLLWFIGAAFVFTVNAMRRSNARTVDLAEASLHQRLRDDVFGRSTTL